MRKNSTPNSQCSITNDRDPCYAVRGREMAFIVISLVVCIAIWFAGLICIIQWVKQG